ncbi:NlpC/P60 family protein [Streptomyces sp. NPDC127190]|uniref:NlpC/P60 family protein n=1 Tax=unclassified Streptomyces TaxID=2593676 RepID=UPI0036292868
MASHRKPWPGGTHGPGLRGPALATAAFTSVAVLSQTAEAVPAPDGRPSLEEIEKKIDEFYRRADSAAEAEPAARQRARSQESAAARQRARAEAAEAARQGAPFEERGAARQGTRFEEPGAARQGAHAASAEASAARRPAHAAEARRDDPGQDDPRAGGARPAGRHARARAGLVPFAAAPDVAASLLDEFPQDHFAPSRVMNRLASRVKDAAERTRATAGGNARGRDAGRDALGEVTDAGPRGERPGTRAMADRGALASAVANRGTPIPAAADRGTATPAAAPYDVKTAKAAVQRKLATARELLFRLTAEADARSAALAGRKRAEGAGPAYGAQVTRAELAVAFARAQIGRPYVSGASGPGSYDASGLTQAAWKAAGVTLPRSARDQAAAGTPVPLADARPGDLVFFYDDSSHVGLCTGNGMMIHSPEPGAYIREDSVYRWGESLVHSVVRPG